MKKPSDKDTVIIYTRNKRIRPSDYYRIVQYTDDLEYNVNIRSSVPERIDRKALDSSSKIVKLFFQALSYICIILNYLFGLINDGKYNPKAIIVVREIFPKKIPSILCGSLKKKCQKYNVIWDFDDDILGKERKEISDREANIYFDYAKRIVVSTPYLKEMVSDKTNCQIDVLDTTDGDLKDIDLEQVNAKRCAKYDENINMIWLATADNLPNLIDVVEFLDDAAKILDNKFNKKLTLNVICNKSLEKKCDFLNVVNIVWSRDGSLEEIKNAHVGIMPLKNNVYAKGKAGFKLIQYMSGGLPVIGSNVGYNDLIIDGAVGFKVDQTDREAWIDAIVSLSGDKSEWLKYSENARKKWDEEYSYSEHLDFWNDLISNL